MDLIVALQDDLACAGRQRHGQGPCEGLLVLVRVSQFPAAQQVTIDRQDVTAIGVVIPAGIGVQQGCVDTEAIVAERIDPAPDHIDLSGPGADTGTDAGTDQQNRHRRPGEHLAALQGSMM